MPRAPRICGEMGCAAIVYDTTKRKCPKHYQPYGGKGGTSRRTTTPAHRRRRLRVLARAGYRCQIRYDGICTGTATDYDHIVPVTEGGQDSDANGQAACRACHARKSAIEARRTQL